MMSYDFDYYSGKDIEYPTRPKKPVLPSKPTPNDYRTYADQIEIYDTEKAEYNEEVMNLGLNLSAFLNSDIKRSMPVTEREWNLCRLWEDENKSLGDLTFWMHVE